MAYSNGLTGRMEELRFPVLRSPEVESPYTNGSAGSRDSNPFFTMQNAANDARGSLQRRFTADSGKAAGARPFSQYTQTNSAAVR